MRAVTDQKFIYKYRVSLSPQAFAKWRWTQVKSKEVITKELFGPQQVPSVMPELRPNGSKSAAILK